MKTVGIITMHRVVNCGSQLQTYALSKVVQALGYECEVVDYQYPALYHYSRRMDQGNWHSMKGAIKLILSYVGVLKLFQYINLKKSEWRLMPKMRSGWCGLRLTRKFDIINIRQNPPSFDIYLVGSDQVWHPGCIVGDYTYLLDFVPDGKRKIAYSASFGVKKLPENEKESYARLLHRFNAIGVREPSGIKILDNIGVKGSVAVLDPSMLLSRRDWETYSTKNRLHSGRYLFCYILSYVFKSSPWVIKYAKDVAASLGCDVVFYGGGERDCIPDAEAAGFTVLKDYITPQDMVRYYLDAEYVIANGFHGTAFAITLGKYCSIVTNHNISDDDRVVSLLERTGYGSRAVKCNVTEYDVSKEWLMGASPVRDHFEKLKSKSIEFLKCALSGEKYTGTYGKDCD